MSTSDCLSACVVGLRLSEKSQKKTTKFYIDVACGNSPALAAQRGDTLCTSGFVDDAYNCQDSL